MRGSGGQSPPPPKKKKQNKVLKNRGFFFISFAFWQGSLNPQNFELAPKLP